MAGSDDGGFNVRPEELTAHATSLDRVGDQMTVAQQAGQGVILGRQAYGYICAFVPAIFDPVQQAVVRVLGDSATKLHGTAVTVRTVASSYRSTDGSVAISYDQTRPDDTTIPSVGSGP